jgi:DNA-directed RNA polymerase subunit F
LNSDNKQVRPVTLSEVKHLLKKISKERKELIYEQKMALEHSNIFAKLTLKKTENLIKELLELDFLQEIHAYKIVDILPKNEDDIKTLFAKERITLTENNINTLLEKINKYCIQ